MQIENLYPIPAGTILDYAGSTAPNGFLLAYGQAISRTTYGTLFAALGTTYGTGDGSTTFNIPDLRGRVPAGKDDMGGTAANRIALGSTLGYTVGAETHTLTTGQIPSHSHVQTTSTATGGAVLGIGAIFGTGTQGTGLSTQSSGSGSSHNNMQPSIIVNKIIKY